MRSSRRCRSKVCPTPQCNSARRRVRSSPTPSSPPATKPSSRPSSDPTRCSASLTPAELTSLRVLRGEVRHPRGRRVQLARTPRSASTRRPSSATSTARRPPSPLPARRAASATSTGRCPSRSAATATSPSRWPQPRCRPGRASPRSSARPLPNGAKGSLLGVYSNDGVEQLVITAAISFSLPQYKTLAHGIISWATRGVHFGYNRNNFTFQVDDAFSSDCAVEHRRQLHARRGLPARCRRQQHHPGDHLLG